MQQQIKSWKTDHPSYCSQGLQFTEILKYLLKEKIFKENYDNIVVTIDDKNILNILSFKGANRTWFNLDNFMLFYTERKRLLEKGLSQVSSP